MLFLIVALKAVTEIALLALLGQAVLWVLAGRGREHNPVYRLFRVLTGPVISLARRVSPRQVLDRHVPLVAALLLGWLWLALTWAKLSLCVSAGGGACA